VRDSARLALKADCKLADNVVVTLAPGKHVHLDVAISHLPDIL
jgi:hypothetical protein